MHRSRLAFSLILALVLALTLARAGDCQSVDLFLDLDADPATGCTVSTVDGDFAGVEEVLRTRTLQSATPPGFRTVSRVERQECVDPATNAFGSWTPVDSTGWLVQSFGIDGTEAVETYWPLPAGEPPPTAIRLGVEVGGDDALLDLAFALAPDLVAVPTLSEWAALLLALLLAAAAVGKLSRAHRAAWLGVFLALAVTTTAWAACVLDGQVDDWVGIEPIGLDPLGDTRALYDSDLRAVLAQECADRICFRVDAILEVFAVP